MSHTSHFILSVYEYSMLITKSPKEVKYQLSLNKRFFVRLGVKGLPDS